MAKSDFIATSAITLKCTLLKQDDERIVTLFSRELGIISLIIKKIGKNDYNKRMLSSTLTRGQYILSSSKSDLFYLVEGSIQDSYLQIRDDLQKLQTAIKMAGIINQTQWPGKAQPTVFDLLTSYLHKLKSCFNPKTLELSFILKLLKHEGLLPPFDLCDLCHEALPVFFSETKLCCKNCAKIQDEPVSYEDLQVLAVLTHATKFNQLQELPISPLITLLIENYYRLFF
jgi:DNA repair protein RecO